MATNEKFVYHLVKMCELIQDIDPKESRILLKVLLELNTLGALRSGVNELDLSIMDANATPFIRKMMENFEEYLDKQRKEQNKMSEGRSKER